ncbi:unnamed protein product [marine sediment metagenome]|uniref:Uncharacterized protein n=1 Tax=marine sediment metagenome TaxID=412755 RepID=X0YJL0_9ZZZZ
MQNKPNFPDDQMNVNKVLTTDYENKSNWTLGENKPNTNPIQTQSKPIKAKTNPIQTQFKPNSNPIKPNFKRYLAKMGHHEAVKCVDTAPQFTLNLIKDRKSNSAVKKAKDKFNEKIMGKCCSIQ